MRLVLRSRKEYLVAASDQGVNERLPGKVVSRADLSAFKDCPGALIACPIPVQLRAKTAVFERLGQLLDLLLAELVSRRFLLSAPRCASQDSD